MEELDQEQASMRAYQASASLKRDAHRRKQREEDVDKEEADEMAQEAVDSQKWRVRTGDKVTEQ